jgi:hypothetical protein
MGGGLMQLVASGSQDIYITGNPQITFFKRVYVRHTPFSIESIEQTLNGTVKLGNTVSATIERKGDLVHKMYLEATIEDIQDVNVPTHIGHKLIDQVEVEIGGQVIDRHTGEWMHIWNELTGDISKKNAFKEMTEFEPGNNIDFNELETKVTYKISWVDSAWLFDTHNFSFTLNYVLDQSHDNSIINVNLNENEMDKLKELILDSNFLSDTTIVSQPVNLTDRTGLYNLTKNAIQIENIEFTSLNFRGLYSEGLSYNFNLELDCIIQETNEIIHIVLSKTGIRLQDDIDSRLAVNKWKIGKPLKTYRINTAPNSSFSNEPHPDTNYLNNDIELTLFEGEVPALDDPQFEGTLPVLLDSMVLNKHIEERRKALELHNNRKVIFKNVSIKPNFIFQNINTKFTDPENGDEVTYGVKGFYITITLVWLDIETNIVSSNIDTPYYKSYINWQNSTLLSETTDSETGQRHRIYEGWTADIISSIDLNNEKDQLEEQYKNINYKTSQKKLYIPLEFWFCRNIGLALPLISLQYHEVKINIKFNSISNINLIDMKLYIDYVFLDTKERKEFAQASHEYLIEQVQMSGNELLNVDLQNNIDITFNHPVKALIWTIAKEKNNYDYVEHKDLKILVNGHDRFSPRDGKYFSVVQPYQHMPNVPTKPIHLYSFGLYPYEHQHSGSCNMSRINNSMMILNSKMTNHNQELQVYALNYNILKITSGMGGLAFSN